MTPKVNIKITGHHINKALLKKDPKMQQQLRTFANLFSEALADEVGVEVSSLIGSGNWWISRNPRFGYYRAWVKTRYGSDRKRKAGGESRRVGSPSVHPYDEHDNPGGLSDSDDVAEWGNIQHLTMQWLIKKLRSVSLPAQDARRRPRVYITGVKTGSGAIDITAAITRLERVARLSNKMTDSVKLDARARRKRNLDALLSDTSLVNRTLKESRYGQKLLRQAELNAIRELRQQQAKKSTGNTNARERRKINRGGNYKWGVQTGQLRNAWGNPTWKKRFDGRRLNVSVAPNSASNGINAWRLTQILQRKIVRAGGNGALIRPGRLRRVVNRALMEVRNDAKTRGLRMRFKLSK